MPAEPPALPALTGDQPRRTDQELLSAHVQGDPEAFNELVRRHRDRLWAVALRTTGDPEEAADALQDGLISAFRNAAGFRGDSAVTTWLHRVVVNASLDRLRRDVDVGTSMRAKDDFDARAIDMLTSPAPSRAPASGAAGMPVRRASRPPARPAIR